MCHHGEQHHGQGCDCEGKSTHSHCGCGGSGPYQRNNQTQAEQIADLETYLGEPKLEVRSVEERLAELRGQVESWFRVAIFRWQTGL